MMHFVDGSTTFQSYSKDGKSAIYSVSRGDLNCKLMTLAEQNAGVKITFNHRCTNMNVKTGDVTFQNTVTNEKVTRSGNTHLAVLGTDGAFSAVRNAMMKTPFYDYSQSYLPYGYKELHIPPGPSGQHQMDKNCLHIWPRKSFMMIALPNTDGSFTVTCFFPMKGDFGLGTLDNSDDNYVSSFFQREFPDAFALMPTLLHDFRANPTSGLVTIRCFPWSIEDKCCLFGRCSCSTFVFLI
jgi:kynurenine 3-monooxygenase